MRETVASGQLRESYPNTSGLVTGNWKLLTMVVSEIQAQYIDENDLFRTVLKRIYEEWDATQNRWILKKIEYIFEDPAYPVPSDDVAVAVETRNGWLIPPDWKFSSEVWIYTRKPVDEVTYEHDSEVMVIKADE